MIASSRHSSDLADRIQRCRRQQQVWSTVSVGMRLRYVRAFRRLLVEECDRLCDAVARDTGKTAAEALAGDILPLADACRFLERAATGILRPRHMPSRHRPLWLWGQRDTVHRRPRGLVGIIGTWNYPLFLNGVQIVQALTAGNGVVWKPSEVAPTSAAALSDLLQRAGYPTELFKTLEATRAAGQELADADVDHMVFTGSSATGRRLAAHLGGRLVSCTLELSGCDALFVLGDADVPLAARAAWFGATMNRGQTCLAVRRAFVQRSRYREFVDTLRPLLAADAVPLALPAQVEQADRLVREAVSEGAHLLEPGESGGSAPGRHVPGMCRPTVVLDARPEMTICREAYFAPVMAVLPFDDLEDALRMDGQCRYALGASIFTNDLSRAPALASRLRAGMVAVNDVIVPTAHPATPFGGRGESGWGVTQGVEGLLDMTVPQVVSVRGGRYRPHYDLGTNSRVSQDELVRALLAAAHGATWGQRCRGFYQVVRVMWRMR